MNNKKNEIEKRKEKKRNSFMLRKKVKRKTEKYFIPNAHFSSRIN